MCRTSSSSRSRRRPPAGQDHQEVYRPSLVLRHTFEGDHLRVRPHRPARSSPSRRQLGNWRQEDQRALPTLQRRGSRLVEMHQEKRGLHHHGLGVRQEGFPDQLRAQDHSQDHLHQPS